VSRSDLAMKRHLSSIFLALAVLCAAASLTFCSGEVTEETLVSRAKQIHERVLTVDTHCDTPMRMAGGTFDMGERHEPGRRSGKIDLPRMREGGLDAEFFAVFVGQGELVPEGYQSAYEQATTALNAIHTMCESYPEWVELAVTPDDAYRLEREGKRAAFIGMENGFPIGRDLSLIEEFYARGVRYITLCHSSDNDICDSSTDRRHPEDLGLSDFGKKVVAECNQLGIMVDISHASDNSFFDILEHSRAPIIASHSSVRALCDHPRNLSDDMIRALAEKDGVIQICFVSSFIKPEAPNPERDKAMAALQEKYGPFEKITDRDTQTKLRQEYRAVYEQYPPSLADVKDLIDHVDHVVELVGVDHVGLGTDFDGGGGVEGCNDVSEMPNITIELLRRGYSEDDIAKIWGGNLMRVFRDVLSVSRDLASGS
jgi:membrane dipeptidase